MKTTREGTRREARAYVLTPTTWREEEKRNYQPPSLVPYIGEDTGEVWALSTSACYHRWPTQGRRAMMDSKVGGGWIRRDLES